MKDVTNKIGSLVKTKIVVGLVGEKGSGKETFTDCLEKIIGNKSIIRIRSSDILVETLNLWDIPVTRSNLQNLAVTMKDGFGDGVLTRAVSRKINHVKFEIIIFDGIRWKSDVVMLRTFSQSLLVYITAGTKIRFERLVVRKEKEGEGAMTFEQFLREEKAQTEVFIPEIGAEADYKIVNNGSLEELKKTVDQFRKKFLKT